MSLNRLRLLTILGPILGLIVLEILALSVLRFVIPDTVQRLVLMFGLLIIAAAGFSTWVFRIIERRQRQVEAANAAITAISRTLDPETVLQHIVDSARELVAARYGALGVSDENGRILQFITSGITRKQRAAIGPLPQGHGLLGALISDATPMRVTRIQEDPNSSGFPPNHPPMTSLLGVPIMLGDTVLGDLYLTDKIGSDRFSGEDQEVLMLLANHAAVAITNARLFAEAQSSRNDLQALNLDLEAQVAERSRRIAEQSREMTRRVLQAQEEERKRIARELHDETAQSLSTLLINIDLLELQVPTEGGQMRDSLERLRALAKRTLDETRALSHDLRPTILDDVGLVAAIQWFAAVWAKSFDLPVRVRVDTNTELRLPPDTELALFRISQEALTNAGKYSRASHVEISLEFPDSTAKLMVCDDGRGFDMAQATGPTRAGGLGLYGMRERAELIGGTLEVDSSPGQGTRIIVTAPVAPEPVLEPAG